MPAVKIALKAAPVAWSVIAAAQLINSSVGESTIALEFVNDSKIDGKATAAVFGDVSGTEAVLDALQKAHPTVVAAARTPAGQQWLANATSGDLAATDFRKFGVALESLDHYLTLRSLADGYTLSIVDLGLWGALKASAIFNKNLKANPSGSENGPLGVNVCRYFNHLSSLAQPFEAAVATHAAAQERARAKPAAAAGGNAAAAGRAADQGKFVALEDAVKGQVVVRFPPEPSGYLHIGHAKAAMLNQYFAQHYEGKLVVRFDDTNPTKEKSEFEEAIIEDLELLGIKGDFVSHTSDYFDQMYEYAIQLIKSGKAYVDNSDRETMQQQRMDGIPSACRDQSVEENLRRFDEMFRGTEFGQTCALRAKMSVDDKNKAMRDPVIYRCVLQPHHMTGDKWKIYPTYDFACPIVDSVEGVTHALRTTEYKDRAPQYKWFLKNLGLRAIKIWEYSRVNFVYTLLSKRKLQALVDRGVVTGWDDPRFPTVRGIRRRGLTIEALRQYTLMQGASQTVLNLEWDKLWAVNKKIIDPVAPRHTAVDVENVCVVKLTGEGAPAAGTVDQRQLARHKKNPELGDKQFAFTDTILLDKADAATLAVGEEITLVNWGNAIVRNITKDAASGAVTAIDMDLHLAGDFKKTEKKLTWLADTRAVASAAPVAATLLTYDYLITKKKLEDDDNLDDFLTPVSEFAVEALVDHAAAELKKGDIIQLERRGYYIVDQAFDAANPATSIKLINIPDGKAATTQSKAAESASPSPAPSAASGAATKSLSGKVKLAKAPKGPAAASPSPSPAAAESKSSMYALANPDPPVPMPSPEQVSDMFAAPVIINN
ncbi:glutamyl-tRNA synthetase [Ramicandelaber brevisporus]|nr:glutamyl-tRNA synthetase [Ramicandelaber brevisporus]